MPDPRPTTPDPTGPAAAPGAPAGPGREPSGPGALDGVRARTPPAVAGHAVHRLLGVGASATVWAATDPDGADVAIKVVDAVAGEEALLREVSLLRAVDHPGVVRLRAVERTAPGPGGGRLALVLDRAHGGGLGALVAARGALAVEEVVGLLVALAEVLAALHARGLVHGDLSPGNVLFAADGAPLLADWGLSAVVPPSPARAAGGGEVRGGTATGASVPGGAATRGAPGGRASGGVVEGTSGFADPSRSPGDPPGPAGDVRALAAVAWFALTGRPPAEREDRLPLPVLVEGVPVALALLLDRALSPLVSRRPGAAELAGACRALDLAAPVRLVPTDPWACPGELMTHRLRAAAAAEVLRTAVERRGVLRGRRRAVLTGVGGVCAAAALGTGAWVLAGQLLGAPSAAREAGAAVGAGSPATGTRTAPETAARTRAQVPAGAPTEGEAGAVTASPAGTPGGVTGGGVTGSTRAAPVTSGAGATGPAAPAPAPAATSASGAGGGSGTGADEQDPVAAVAVLAQRRAAAFTAGQPALLAEVNAPGSPAAVVDAAALADLAAGGVRVEGLSIEVTAAERVAAAAGDPALAEGDEAVVRAVVRTSAYRRTDAGGAVTAVAASGPVTSVLVLRRTGGRWLLAGTR